MSVFGLQGACLHAAAYGSMSRHSRVDFPFSCLFLAPKCLFFIMILAKYVRREIVINLHDLGVKFASKSHNECIKHAQMLCNFTPNKISKEQNYQT